MKFEFWSIDEVKNAIRTLEEAIANGVSNASYPGGGSIQYTSQANMKNTLVALYKAYSDKNGDSKKTIKRVMFSNPRKGL